MALERVRQFSPAFNLFGALAEMVGRKWASSDFCRAAQAAGDVEFAATVDQPEIRGLVTV
jgi:hypothetical protein